MRVPDITWDGDQIRYDGSPWSGQRIVRSLKTPKRVSVVVVVANVQEPSKEKWGLISGKALQYGAHLIMLQEVGPTKDFGWNLSGYAKTVSRIRGPKRGMAISEEAHSAPYRFLQRKSCCAQTVACLLHSQA